MTSSSSNSTSLWPGILSLASGQDSSHSTDNIWESSESTLAKECAGSSRTTPSMSACNLMQYGLSPPTLCLRPCHCSGFLAMRRTHPRTNLTFQAHSGKLEMLFFCLTVVGLSLMNISMASLMVDCLHRQFSTTLQRDSNIPKQWDMIEKEAPLFPSM